MSLLLLACVVPDPGARAQEVPAAGHVVVIVMENKSYDEVRSQPYVASLIAGGSSMSASYALTHPSQPNYLALWSGGFQGVTSDSCPAPGSPFPTENVGHACEAAGVSWRAYSENLPYAGYPGCNAAGGLYARRHCPWANFANLDHQRERPFSDLAYDISGGALPRLAFVIPNNCHNTHDCSIPTGDNWLAAVVPTLLEAVGPTGFVLLTWDEDDHSDNNHILTVFSGGRVRGGYVSPRPVTHYTVLRTICDALGLPPIGAAAFETPITDVWNELPPETVTGIEPPRLALREVEPNPSTGEFEALLELSPGSRLIEASIFDAAGRRIRRLWEGAPPERGRLRWDDTFDDGRRAPPGVYFMRVRAGAVACEQRLVLAR